MIKDFPLTTAIQNHRLVYLQAGFAEKNIPSYRVTCEEHKKLVAEFNTIFGDNKKEMIKSYNGVEIEVVMVVQPYC